MPTPPDKAKKVASAADQISSSSDVDVDTAPSDRQPVSPVAPLSPAPLSPVPSFGDSESVATVSAVDAVIDGVNDMVDAVEDTQDNVSSSRDLDMLLSPEEEIDLSASGMGHGSGAQRTSAKFKERKSDLSHGESSTSTMGASMSVEDQRQIEQRIAIQQISRGRVEYNSAWMSARSWQLNPWHPDHRVVAYLAQFGLDAKDQYDWEETPKESCVELKVSLDQHVENADATWYQLECKLRQKNASIEASWQAPRRLKQIRCSLHDRVSLALGSRYNWLFEDAHFALPFAPRGTTARLRLWFQALTDHINDGTLSPELAALTFFFLQVPVLERDGEETAAPDFYTPSERSCSDSLRT